MYIVNGIKPGAGTARFICYLKNSDLPRKFVYKKDALKYVEFLKKYGVECIIITKSFTKEEKEKEKNKHCGQNNTKYSYDEIVNNKNLFTINNKWMQRTINVYEHPVDLKRVISVGIPYNCDVSSAIISDDNRDEWHYELSRMKNENIHYFIKS